MSPMIVGIDIGGDAVRAVKLKGNKIPRLYDYLTMDLQPSTISHGQLNHPLHFTDALLALKEELRLSKDDHIYLSLPDHLVRFADVIIGRADSYSEALESARDIVSSRKNLYTDPVTALMTPVETEDRFIQPYTVALNKHIRSYLNCFSQVGLQVVSLEPQAIGDYRFLSDHMKEDAMLVHVTSYGASLTACRQSTHQMFGLKVSFDDPFDGRDQDAINKIARAARIQCELFEALPTDRALPAQIKNIYVLGCNTAPLVKTIGIQTGINVVAPNIWHNPRLSGWNETEEATLYPYLTAFGLAFKHFPPPKGEKQDAAPRRKFDALGRLCGALLRPVQEVVKPVAGLIARVRGDV